MVKFPSTPVFIFAWLHLCHSWSLEDECGCVFEVLRFLMETQKVISCDVAEMNPFFDFDGRTAGLAALLVEWMLRFRGGFGK